MARKGDILVNAWTTTDHYINPSKTVERFMVGGIGIVRTLRRNGEASTYDSFQGAYDWERPQQKRQVPAAGVYIVPREKFGSMTDEQIAAAIGGRKFESLEEIREAIRTIGEPATPAA